MKIYKTFTLNREHIIKQKLKNILFSAKFCGLCFETGNNYDLLNDELRIETYDGVQDLLLSDVYSHVFNEQEDSPASNFICNKCTEQLKKSYIFIKNSKSITNILKTYLEDLESKSNDLISHLERNESASTNIVIVLENSGLSGIGKIKKEDVNYRNAFTHIDKVSLKCIKCKKNLPSLKVWKLHTKECHLKQFKCTQCSKTFINQQKLSAHYKVHAKSNCRICNLIFSHEDIKHHLRKIHEDEVYICNICTEVFYTLEGLEMHAKIKHAIKQKVTQNNRRKIDCTECADIPCIHNKYLISYRDQKAEHATKIKCLDCDYVCSKRNLLIAHANREHLNYHPYTCDTCGQQFYYKLLLRAHITRCHSVHSGFNVNNDNDDRNNSGTHLEDKTASIVTKREFNFVDCNVLPKLLASDEIKPEKKTRIGHFPCQLCNKEFKLERKIKEHMYRAHSGVQIKNKRWTLDCAVCEQVFDTRGELAKHMKSHGPNVKYPCRKCNTEYDTVQKLRKHVNKHTYEPNAVCDLCGKRMRKVAIAKHINNHKFDNIKCDVCGKTCTNLIALKYHKKTHLPNVPCPKCNKMISQRQLNRHLKKHAVDEDPKFKRIVKRRPKIKCEQCDYETCKKMLIECHMNRYHLKIKPYVCHICSKNFTGPHLLRRHVVTHSSDKPMVCIICGKKFANGTCLKLHLRLHTGEKNYPCDICGEKFRTSSIMNVHKRRNHLEKSNACPLCSSKFYGLGALRNHIMRVHWKDKSKKFNPREMKGLEDHYHIFHDNRRIKFDEKDVDFYLPC